MEQISKYSIPEIDLVIVACIRLITVKKTGMMINKLKRKYS